jgi:feruloyl esterase
MKRFLQNHGRLPRLCAAVLALMPVIASGAGTTCEGLASVSLPDTTISLAQSIPAGTFTPPGNPPIANLPPFCRVAGVTSPAIKFEVWLPLQNWNGKFQGVGNGGTAGIISYSALATALRRGYATASTDTGHVSSGSFDATWALGRPDLVADFGYRGTHVMSVNGVAVTSAFYGQHPNHSYFVGCSKGGQQALMEAQRFPEDYDGIIGGDPANNWTRFYAGGHLWYSLATLKDPESYIPANKTAILGNAVTAACDAHDGVVDGVLSDPRECHFDPAVLTCATNQDPNTCYTPKQVTAIKQIWSGVKNSAGQLVYPGLLPGGEAGPGSWAAWLSGAAPFGGLHYQAAFGFFAYMVFGNPAWDFRTFNYDTDLPFALAKVGPLVDAVDPNLQPFQSRGGKLIMYHGFSDPDISPTNSINYFDSVVAAQRPGRGNGIGEDRVALRRTQDFLRLFMVPGMNHCAGGPGTDQFDMVTALEEWVEQGTAPDRILASHVANGAVTFTRPLCPYPQLASYTGSGNPNDAANFVCASDEDAQPADGKGH